MLAQALVEYLFLDGLALLVLEHPVGKLRMPAEVMSTQFDTVLTAEIGNAVGSTEVPNTFLGLHQSHLHVIFCSDAVEVLLDECNLVRILNVSLVHCDTNGEIVFVGIFQSNSRIWINWLRPLCECGHATCYKQGQSE